MSVIYAIKSKKHNKIVYIGKCLARPLKDRIKTQKRDALVVKRKSKLCSAIRKYGWKNFSYIVLEECPDDNELLCHLERKYIEEHNTYIAGYNMTKGGDGKPTVNVACYDDLGRLIDTFKSLYEAATKGVVWYTNISQATKNGNRVNGLRYRYFKKTPNLKIEPYVHKASKKVFQFSREGLLISSFPSAKIAEKFTKIKSSNIGSCARGEIKQAGGFIWSYKGELS